MYIVQHLFADHPFLCCICSPWLIHRDGATPLFTSAYNGHKEVVDILLQNGAEVNATCEVICDEWQV